MSKKTEIERKEKVEEYTNLIKERGNPFVRIDSRLRVSSKLSKFKESIFWVRLMPLVLMVSMAIGFIIFAVSYQNVSDNQKMINLSAFVAVVSIFIPIIQYMWNRGNEISNKKIEHHMLLQNQILINSSNLSKEDKEYAEEVLWRIEFLNISSDEEFLDKRFDEKIEKLGNELQNLTK